MPLAEVELLMTGGPAVMVIIRVAALLVPEEFVAVRVTVKLAAVVGVPLMTPVVELRVNHAGKPIAAKLLGELVAVIW